jgi:hypothetical protein
MQAAGDARYSSDAPGKGELLGRTLALRALANFLAIG